MVQYGRSRVVSALSRFGPASFRPGSFRPWSFRPNLVGRFGLIFSKSPGVRYDRLKKNVVREWG